MPSFAASRFRPRCCGAGTTASSRSILAERASARLGWPLHVIEDAGHVPHIERTDAFVRALSG